MYSASFTIDAAMWPALEETLEGLGAMAVTQTGGDTDLFDEPDLTAREHWTRFAVEALFEDDVPHDHVRRALRAYALEIRFTALADEAWAESWKTHWQPQLFAAGLCVCPSWCEPPAAARTLIRLDPGQAFGTGTHPSTALCLDWLASQGSLQDLEVIDYGCGSGILAIAAALLGARRVTAVDIDPGALTVAHENASLNGVATHITITAPEHIERGRADILLANILLEPLLALAASFAEILPVGGRIVLAGLLQRQVDDVLAAYAARFTMHAPVVRGEWAMLAGVRRA